MERTLIGNLRQATGQKVMIQGWLQSSARPEEDAVSHPARPHRAGAGGFLEAQ
jgi:hypothetical protein